MSRIIRAKVISNSCEDKYARVKLQSPGVWQETPLVESIGGIPLKTGDFVFVDITKVENPLILGRSMHKDNSFAKQVDGSLLFESSDGSHWTIGIVKNNRIEIVNSDGVSIVVEGSSTTINSENLKLNGTIQLTGTSVEASGNTTPGTSGPFNCISNCAFTGAPHAGTKVQF